MVKKWKYLLKPEGVRDLLPELAVARRQVENTLIDVFQRWGYFEVVTPTLEYSSLFGEGLKANYEDKMYRFLDSRGRTLVLRPDWTLPLARVVSSHLTRERMPLRLAYFGNVFRFTSPQLGKQREFFQAGVELIGTFSPRGDAEIIALAIAALNEVGVKDLKICIGHTRFLRDLLDVLPLDSSQQNQIKEYFSAKDFVSLKEFIDRLDLEPGQKKMILSVPQLKGGPEILESAWNKLPDKVSRDSLAELKAVYGQLTLHNLENYVTFDLALVRGLEYYTGMVFEGYTSHLGFPLCGGGRYDHLLGHFGFPQPAVGFALSVDNLLIVLSKLNLMEAPRVDVFIAFHPARQRQALQKAMELRGKGLKVVLDVTGCNKEESREYARQKRISRLIYVGEEGVEEQSFDTAGAGFVPEVKETWPGLHS